MKKGGDILFHEKIGVSVAAHFQIDFYSFGIQSHHGEDSTIPFACQLEDGSVDFIVLILLIEDMEVMNGSRYD
jgi:hypothetical protein